MGELDLLLRVDSRPLSRSGSSWSFRFEAPLVALLLLVVPLVPRLSGPVVTGTDAPNREPIPRASDSFIMGPNGCIPPSSDKRDSGFAAAKLLYG